MTIKIIGAGMAGLLAANMLRHHNPVVIEAQESLPNNHSAVLRFRSSIVSDVLGIPFKKVRMIKAPLPWRNPIADALSYSEKNTGVMRTDRSITDGMVVAERYIAPPNLIDLMARNVDIRLGESHDFKKGDKVISTIPMPVLQKALMYDQPSHFRYTAGFNIRAEIANCDAYVSLLVPSPEYVFSRISITGGEMIIECPNHLAIDVNEDIVSIVKSAVQLLGISFYKSVGEVSVHPQTYQKILPIPEDERRNFIYWASTITGRAYQLGRFATWRPNLLLDDLVKDIRLIDGWISSGSAEYDQQRHERSK